MSDQPRARDLKAVEKFPDAVRRWQLEGASNVSPSYTHDPGLQNAAIPVLLPADADPVVSLECYAALYGDFQHAIGKRRDAEDQRDLARRKLRNCRLLLCAAWAVAVGTIAWRWL